MASNGRKKVVASRRRREDEGEEEGSVAGELEDNSLSEGSVLSNGDDDADIEPSDVSEEDATKAQHSEQKVVQPSPNLTTDRDHIKPETHVVGPVFPTSSETNAMMDGLRLAEERDLVVVESDETMVNATESSIEHSTYQSQALREGPTERSRREHLEYLKQKKENPAFVPNRGGFFLHDNRAVPSGPGGFRAPPRGRVRGGFSGFQSSRIPPFLEPTDQPWAHDLHDSVSIAEDSISTKGKTSVKMPSVNASATLPPANQAAPNRSFSTSILLGKVPVIINLFGMQERICVQNVAKKKHTLLPQHRPPLRRDKPVRISLPEQQPRYIFPSTERSFIFIPRALRPNQQGFGRGRGRSSFNPSRRTSVYGGSTYTPSVAMSRRSSLGGVMVPDGLRSPTASALLLPASYVTEQGKPVVRFPPPGRPMAMLPLPAFSHANGAALHAALPNRPVFQSGTSIQENGSDALTMHQPRPRKTISVSDIESPARFSYNPPQQQQEQPFHQQMPVPTNPPVYADHGNGYQAQARRLSYISRPGGTLLSQIPERAIYAQPFQPLPLQAPVQGFLPPAYPSGAVFYPTMQSDLQGYGSSLGPSMPPAYLTGGHSGSYLVPAPTVSPSAPNDGNVPSGTVAHESNGMVYYYDSSQVPANTAVPYSASYAGAPVGGVVGMGGMMTPPNHFYYPVTSNGVYYAAS